MASMVLPLLHYKSIGMATVAIAGLPTAWNIVARNEYRRHTLEHLFKSKKIGVYFLATCIFVFSGLRDYAFLDAIKKNGPAVLPLLPTSWIPAARVETMKAAMKVFGVTLTAAGTTLVVSSFARLGVTGTYLGDYFGITMRERVTAFPFSHFENPMYLGAILNFLGSTVAANSAVGAALTAWVCAVYYVSSTYFENPFTAKIYAEDISK